jgi:hypothetical protein
MSNATVQASSQGETEIPSSQETVIPAGQAEPREKKCETVADDEMQIGDGNITVTDAAFIENLATCFAAKFQNSWKKNNPEVKSADGQFKEELGCREKKFAEMVNKAVESGVVDPRGAVGQKFERSLTKEQRDEFRLKNGKDKSEFCLQGHNVLG